MISLLFPSLTRIVQPLSGEYAARRTVLEHVPFVQGYGVDLGLLLDVEERCGAAAIAQVDLVSRRHRNRSLDELSPQALSILQTAFAAPVCRPAAPPPCAGPGCRPSRAPTSSGRRWPTCAPNAAVEPAPDPAGLEPLTPPSWPI